MSSLAELNSSLDWNRLRVFYFIYRSKSAAEAASLLRITPSAISQTLKQLETELGKELFLRVGGRLKPTEASHELNSVLQPFMESLQTYSQGSTQQNPLEGRLVVLSPPKYTSEILIPSIQRLQAQHPAVHFVIRTTTTAGIHSFISEGEGDLCISDSVDLYFSQKIGSLIRHKVHEEPEVLVCSKTYKKKVIQDLKDLYSGHFISYSEGGADILAWLKFVGIKSSRQVMPVLAVDNVFAMEAAIRANIGMGILPMNRLDSSMVNLAPPGVSFKNEVSLVRRKSKYTPVFVTEFVKLLRQN